MGASMIFGYGKKGLTNLLTRALAAAKQPGRWPHSRGGSGAASPASRLTSPTGSSAWCGLVERYIHESQACVVMLLLQQGSPGRRR
ncbi:MAG: hypothetical protein ACK583_10230 [Cyanobacteriota bacterium]